MPHLLRRSRLVSFFSYKANSILSSAGSILIPSQSNADTSILSNGHLSPLAQSVMNADDVAHSESELSDPKDHPVEVTSAQDVTPADNYDDDNDVDMDETDTSESSQEEDADGSEDGDYDIETPPPAQSDAGRPSSSGSEESRRPSKRKASVEDDEYIMKDPELYGLRRSVRTCFLTRMSVTNRYQGRARSNRRIVSLPKYAPSTSY